MYKVQDFIKTIRNTSTSEGVITIDAAQARVDKYRSLESVSVMGSNPEGFLVTNAIVFVDCYSFGFGVLPSGWVSSSTGLPMRCEPRPELPSGIISTVQDYMTVFHDKETVVLQSIQELVDYLNKENDKK